MFVVFNMMLWTINSTLGSALASIGSSYIMAEWGVTSETQSVLPQSIYLVGYVRKYYPVCPLSTFCCDRSIVMGVSRTCSARSVA